MITGSAVSVTLTRGKFSGKTLLLDVEEFCEYEPSRYVWMRGWNCAVEIEGELEWFFVDETGHVYYTDVSGESDYVGICPQQKVEYARLADYERQFADD